MKRKQLLGDVKSLRDEPSRRYDAHLQILLSEVVAYLEDAAAPDLLAACKQAYATFHGVETIPATCEAMDALLAAIAKAEGR